MELHELRNSVELALDMVHDTRTILAAEVCASWCEQQVVRLRHDTEHPSEDVQALQAHTTYGISFLVVSAFGRSTLGLAYSIFPFVVIDRLTIWEAAAHPSALKALMIGTAIVLPFIVGYTIVAYRIFRGKAAAKLYD